jgi:hypothetical protein
MHALGGSLKRFASSHRRFFRMRKQPMSRSYNQLQAYKNNSKLFLLPGEADAELKHCLPSTAKHSFIPSYGLSPTSLTNSDTTIRRQFLVIFRHRVALPLSSHSSSYDLFNDAVNSRGWMKSNCMIRKVNRYGRLRKCTSSKLMYVLSRQ